MREPEFWSRSRGPSYSNFRWMLWNGAGTERWFEDEDEADAAWTEAHRKWRSTSGHREKETNG